MSYDSGCYELAAKFLEDSPEIDTALNRRDLAQTIQDAIEDWLQEAKNTGSVSA